MGSADSFTGTAPIADSLTNADFNLYDKIVKVIFLFF